MDKFSGSPWGGYGDIPVVPRGLYLQYGEGRGIHGPHPYTPLTPVPAPARGPRVRLWSPFPGGPMPLPCPVGGTGGLELGVQ